MRVVLRLGLILLAATPVFAQAQSPAQTPPAQSPAVPESPAVKAARHRLGMVATRAIAYFRSADTIAESLEAMGVALHPQIVVLRYRTEAQLDAGERAIDRGDLDEAKEALDRAEGFLEKFIKRLGGS